MSDEVILYDDEAAARYVTGIEGWVDRHGHFFGKNEHIARSSGCTHYKCEDCGSLTNKYWKRCQSCIEARKNAEHAKREHVDWDLETPVYSELLDRYFFDEDELLDILGDRGLSAESARLLLCAPQYLRPVETDYWADDLPDTEYVVNPDEVIPTEVWDALQALNSAIESAGPVSWIPTETAVTLQEDEDLT